MRCMPYSRSSRSCTMSMCSNRGSRSGSEAERLRVSARMEGSVSVQLLEGVAQRFVLIRLDRVQAANTWASLP